MFNKVAICFLPFLLVVTMSCIVLLEKPSLATVSENSVQAVIDEANKGDPNAQFKLGEMYFEGNDGRKDCNEAFKWYSKAAEQGVARAQYKLGLMYYSGQAVPPDCNKAIEYFTKSAEQGNTTAQVALGEMYYDGEDVPQNYKEAAKWYKKAADGDDATAQRNLALMYGDGKGVVEDYIEAYKWALLAGMKDEDVVEIKKDLVAKMTPDQIAMAQKLAKDFDTKKETVNNVSNKETDKISVKRLFDNIQKMKDAIELVDTRLQCMAHTDRLEDEKRRCHLLGEEEASYEKILRLGTKYPDLGIDVMSIKKAQIQVQESILESKSTIESLEKSPTRTSRSPTYSKPHRSTNQSSTSKDRTHRQTGSAVK